MTTAHPHHDPERNELVNYSVHFSRKSEYRLWGLPADSSSRRLIASLPVREPAYMHAFGMSERYLILAEYPLVVNPLKLAFSGKAFIKNYRWQPERGTRFQVLDRETGALRGTYETDAFFCLPPRERVRARQRAGDRPGGVRGHHDHRLAVPGRERAGGRAPAERAAPLHDRARLGLGAPRAAERGHGRAAADRLPAPQHARLPLRVLRRQRSRQRRGWLDRLVKVDVGQGEVASWAEDGCYPGEPIFVRAPGEEAEDGGIILSVVLDTRAQRSFLLVLDAGSFDELARAEAPHHIPFGFHGQYLR